jgi:hypothetical protein
MVHWFRRGAAAFVPLALAAGFSGAYAALPDEIQVYVDDLNDPGKLSLQMHINTTPVGVSSPDYPGENVAAQGLRLTPEFAYGLTRDLEAGAYLPVVHEADGDTRMAGLKLRLKWVPLRPAPDGAGMFAGLNGELSQVGHSFEQDRRAFELRPIWGWRDADWLLATNPVLTFALSGPDRNTAPAFAPSFKVARTVAPGLATGIEYYAEVGTLTDIERLGDERHTLYWALDIDRKPWNVNFGIGRGLTSVTDRWTVKMIIEVPLGE